MKIEIYAIYKFVRVKYNVAMKERERDIYM